jgi:hypothetical protein
MKLGCKVAVETVRDIDADLRVVFCCFSEEDAAAYRAELA